MRQIASILIVILHLGVCNAYAQETPEKANKIESELSTGQQAAMGVVGLLLSNAVVYGASTMENGQTWAGALFLICSPLSLAADGDAGMAVRLFSAAGFLGLAAYNYSYSDFDEDRHALARNNVIGFSSLVLSAALLDWVIGPVKTEKTSKLNPYIYADNDKIFIGAQYIF